MLAKSFAVIGLGDFGTAIVHELVKNGMDVIAIDKDKEALENIAHILPTAFVADSTKEEALEEIGVQNVDVAIVAFGDNNQASILTTIVLNEMGIKRIIVRVDNEYYVPVMKKIGATEVITPQKIAGIDLANRITNKDFLDFYKLDDNYSIVSIVVNDKFKSISLKELNANNLYGVNLVLIKHGDKTFVPRGDDKISASDNIFVVGTTKQIRAFRVAINGK